MELAGYDFIDFGCSKGGSLEFGEAAFGGRGIGIDIDAGKVAMSLHRGHAAVQADITKIQPDDFNKVRFAILSHFLEHLPGISEATACIKAAARLTNEFFWIQQPYFDADGELFERGLKLYWSDWRGHTCHMSTIQIWRILNDLLEQNYIKRFIVGRRYPITNSHCKEIHPISSAVDQVDWDEARHQPRAFMEFTFPVYREVCAVGLHDAESVDPKVEKYLNRLNILYDSRHHEPLGG